MKPVRVPALLLLLVLAGCHRYSVPGSPMQCLPVGSPETAQAVVVSPRDQGTQSDVTVALYEKDGERWRLAAPPMAGMAGRNGLAPEGDKREGDGKTPSGVFALERAFGYEALAIKMPYIVMTPQMIWIDDPKSPRYNTLAAYWEGEQYSHEEMRRKDDLYRYGIVIEYNTNPIVPGKGSAIFFHIRRGPGVPTAGCVALAEADLVAILKWLDPAQHPVAVIGLPTACQDAGGTPGR